MVEVGQTVGNYRVTSKLGEGGMGAVFLAEHPVIGRLAALKVIHPRHARNAEVLTRFVNEATAINRIGHEHIVEVTDFGRTPEGDFYFIMEYLEGHPLSDLIERDAPLPPARALAIAAQIADALSASHAHGVVHRDLKPENIFLVARGDDPSFVKVLDFGVAKLVNNDDTSPIKTAAGTVMGTPYYMAPEQCQGRSELDARADIYSLGVVLFEMLTGKLPFGGDNYAEVFMKQVSMQPPLARSLVPALPAVLDVILQRALAKRPSDRFATMTELRDALLAPERHGVATFDVQGADDHSARMRAARPMSRAEITSGHAPVVAMTGADLDEVPRRRGPRLTALVLATAAAGIVLAAGLTRQRHPSTMHPATLIVATPAAPAIVSLPSRVPPAGAPAPGVVDPPPDDVPSEEPPAAVVLKRAAAAPSRRHRARPLERRTR
ncbi:MAG: serine/threonine protein kinase, partial [Myxococcales bacterium]|nr:serine/threonine protein kinase [Myxococcales bacterium]